MLYNILNKIYKQHGYKAVIPFYCLLLEVENGVKLKVLAIGDVVSAEGVNHLRHELPKLKKELETDIVIVNGENSAVGNGITPQSANEIFACGADVITLGNHSLRRREIYGYLDDENNPVIRPANYHSCASGRGYCIIDKGYCTAAVINLQGIVFLDAIENPFAAIDKILDEISLLGINTILVDFHAEATSEKRAMGFYLDGRVSALFGTHTHVQTSDNQILPNGTGYITDLGMTGAINSVLGVEPECVIKKLKTALPVKFESAKGECVLEGCLFEIDGQGKTVSTQLIRR